jgi:acyl carrier protein
MRAAIQLKFYRGMKNMFETVRSMIAKQLKVDESTITRDSRLIDDLHADSANIMVMIMDLEDQFGIVVEDDQIMKMKTVGNVVDYIESHQ